MVELKVLSESQEAALDELDDQYVDQESDFESDSDDFLEDESLLDRLSALVDIIPPTTRQKISNTVYACGKAGYGLGRVAGNGLWVLATGALLVFLPVGLELEREAVMIQQEQQLKAQAQVN